MSNKNKGGAEYQDFILDPLDGSVSLNRSLEDNELVQPVILVVKVVAPDTKKPVVKRKEFIIIIILFFLDCCLQNKGSPSRQPRPLRFDHLDR